MPGALVLSRDERTSKISYIQRKAHGPPKTIKQDNIIHRALHLCSQGAHKPPQSCEERKPAPPNEEQFNAPTIGGRAMNPIASAALGIV